MKRFRVLGWFFAGALLLVADQSVQAAWNNVFQVTCKKCRGGSSSSSYYISNAPLAVPSCTSCAPPCDPCQTCTTRYIQKTFYQQVTSYQSQTVYDPVTTYKTSYYWEPVVSYRYTSYYDPSTCCMKQQACPTTSYRLRSQCCPVQSFVARCVSVPVVSYKPVCYYEPQTTCCSTTSGPMVPAGSETAIPAQPGLGTNPPPGVGEQRTPGAGVSDTQEQGGNPYESNRLSPKETIPPASGLLRNPYPRQSQPPPKAQSGPAAQPKVTLDRIAALPSTNIEGDVVANSKNGVTVLFKSADRAGVSQYVTSDDKGHFEASLASGKWLVYTHDSNNRLVLQAKFEVSDKENKSLMLTGK